MTVDGLPGAAAGPIRGSDGALRRNGRRCGSSSATPRRWTWRRATWRTPRRPEGNFDLARQPARAGRRRRRRRAATCAASPPRSTASATSRRRRAITTSARRYHHESLARYREIDDRWGIARVLADLASVDLQAGDYAAADASLTAGAPGLPRAGPSARRRASAGVVVVVRQLPVARRGGGRAGERRGGDPPADRHAGQAGRAGEDRAHAGRRRARGISAEAYAQRVEGRADGAARSDPRDRGGAARRDAGRSGVALRIDQPPHRGDAVGRHAELARVLPDRPLRRAPGRRSRAGRRSRSCAATGSAVRCPSAPPATAPRRPGSAPRSSVRRRESRAR